LAIGDLNKKFGWILLLIFLLFGIYLGFKTGAARTADDMTWLTSRARKAFMITHTHGTALAFLNIFYGMAIDGTALSDRLKRTGSYFAIIGAIVMPTALLLWAYWASAKPYMLANISGVFTIIAVLILVYGFYQKED
jgi:uncharacterized membrane protein